MDIFVTNVPPHANNEELRLFLRDPLRRLNTLAYDVMKKQKLNWAIVTLADENNGHRFLQIHGSRYRSQSALQPLVFHGASLGFKKGNKAGQPSAIKVQALLESERKMRQKLEQTMPRSLLPSPGSGSVVPILSLSTGIWSYDRLGQLTFDVKFKDERDGTVTFGKSALVLYLCARGQQECNWHCRIDIPYSILEHSILSTGNNLLPTITFTLKTPPKIYDVLSTDDLHRYSGKSVPAAVTANVPDMGRLGLAPNTKRLQRLSQLSTYHAKTSAICMVYKVVLPDMDTSNRAWRFVKSNLSMSSKDCWTIAAPSIQTSSIEGEYQILEHMLATLDHESTNALDFNARFQLLALVCEGSLSPLRAMELLPHIKKLALVYGHEDTAAGIRRLGYTIPTPSPKVDAAKLSCESLVAVILEGIKFVEEIKETSQDLAYKLRKHEHLASTYKATVTPTGLLLRGPDLGTANRVLRKYSEHSEYFMRVFFADEDGSAVLHDPRASQENIYSRFRKILQTGIMVAGRNYQFLGFSHSSLHCHAAWFMAPFVHDGRLIWAPDVIKDLGDFTHLQCAAKCAARIGQAFSDTMFAVTLPQSVHVIETMPDVERNGRNFSDGCGTISKALLQRVWKAIPLERRMQQPTILQIRYRGAKGVVSLDPNLTGEQLHIRKSMTKYVATEGWRDLELCGAAYKPLSLFLNHQFIKILEDLGIPTSSFQSIMDEAVEILQKIIAHPVNAADFLEYAHCATAAKIPTLFILLHDIGLSFQADRFLTNLVEVAAMQSLRDMKYRARIPVDKAVLMYGVMDEFNVLKEGEVYITTKTQDGKGNLQRTTITHDRVVVTRAPALHPGDVQVVKAVDVPEDCPLGSLDNCIVFSQRGMRDLPSQLSGGDLDGDLFHIIYDDRLIPDFTEPAADYLPAPIKDLGRTVQRDDIIDFFIEYMQNDRLGQVSNLHKVLADYLDHGTKEEACIQLAELASLAVDFSKSGNPVNMSGAPRGIGNIKPDFMSTGPGMVFVDKGLELEELEDQDVDDPDSISILDPDRTKPRYYKSKKTLGKLFREIDEKKFFARMQDDFQATRNSMGNESLMEKFERYIDRETTIVQWEHYREFAEKTRESYQDMMLDIMNTLRHHRGQPLEEIEVFSGNVLGKKERASSQAVREANIEIQERFNREVSAVIKRIVFGHGFDDEEDEALPRAIACFKISLETQGWENYIEIKSFKYVAAAVCLERLWMYMGFKLRPL